MTTAPATAPRNVSAPAASPPWWRVGWMWLVVGVPAMTVVGAAITIVLAVSTGDPSVRTPGDLQPAHIRQANETAASH